MVRNVDRERGTPVAADEVILEYQRVGAVVKVSAVDPETLVEVTIQGPAAWGEAALRRTALSKLRYVLARRGLAPPHATRRTTPEGKPAAHAGESPGGPAPAGTKRSSLEA
jgi:hypothetical protein